MVFVFGDVMRKFFNKIRKPVSISIDKKILCSGFIFMGLVCWYAKGTNVVSIGISAVIFAIMMRQSFYFGFWYFNVRYGLELLLLIAAVAVLYKTPKQILTVTGFGLLLFFILSPANLFWGML